MLKHRRREVLGARLLWDDLHVAKSSPIRLLLMFYERDCWSPDSRAGTRYLRGLLYTLPDNTLVEDIHNAVRRDARANPNPRQRIASVQDLVIHSGALEMRDIRHPCALTREFFCSRFRHFKRKYTRSVHYAWKHRMSARWSKVLGTKTWLTLSEDASRRSTAAWRWLQSDRRQAPLSSALLSRLLARGLVVQRGASGEAFASFGHASWGALRWPLREVTAGPDRLLGFETRLDTSAVVWLHMTDPENWFVVPWAPARLRDGLFLRQVGEPEPLIQNALRRSSDLSFDDLRRLADRLGVDGGLTRESLLTALGATPEDRGQGATPATTLLVEDPLLEAAFDDMEPEERAEFPELKEARRRGRVRKWQESAVQRRAASKPGPRRRLAKAKAKASVASGAASSSGASAVPAVPLASPDHAPAAPKAKATASGGAIPPPASSARGTASSSGALAVPAAPLPGASAAGVRASSAGNAVMRGLRGEPFGRHFVLAEVYSAGTMIAWS